MAKTTRSDSARRALFIMLALALLAAAVLPLLPASARAESRAVYFERTGQTLSGPLYDAWLDQGGLERVGGPVSPVVEIDGRWAQWFEYARLDITRGNPEQAAADDVAPAPIGRAIADRLGLSRWHPAFKPIRGPLNLGVLSVQTGFPLANGFLEMYEQPGMAERLGLPISHEFGVRGATYQFFQGGALTWTPEDGVRFAPLGVLAAALHGDLRLHDNPPEGVPVYEAQRHFGPAYGGERWIEVDLSNYLLTAYEGTTPVLQSYVVDGGWETPTVRGEFYIYSKLESQTMRGTRPDGTEYMTEDVPWVMYFYADYAIHGAYWRSSFGYSASQGCVNLPVSTAAWLYQWAGYGTRVVVHD